MDSMLLGTEGPPIEDPRLVQLRTDTLWLIQGALAYTPVGDLMTAMNPNAPMLNRVLGAVGAGLAVVPPLWGALEELELAAAAENAAPASSGVTRFVAGVEVKAGGQTLEGTVDLGPTLDRIKSGGSFPYRNDGSVFMNREGLLPKQVNGYYREFVHPTAGVSGPGPQRIILGGAGELYYTPNHYGSFIQLSF
jgi:guanyl-specific ribonuclease Sa